MSIWQGQAMQEAMAAGSKDASSFFETIEAGQETTLAEGDVAYVSGNIAGESPLGDLVAEGTLFLIVPGGTLGAPEGTPAP